MIFIDTSGLYAMLDHSDANHDIAVKTWGDLLEGSMPLVATNYVAVELLSLVQARLGFKAARLLIESILPAIEQFFVDENLHHAAVETLLAQERRRLSLVDCVSFACMRRFHIQRVFSFDKHFAEAGFSLV